VIGARLISTYGAGHWYNQFVERCDVAVFVAFLGRLG